MLSLNKNRQGALHPPRCFNELFWVQLGNLLWVLDGSQVLIYHRLGVKQVVAEQDQTCSANIPKSKQICSAENRWYLTAPAVFKRQTNDFCRAFVQIFFGLIQKKKKKNTLPIYSLWKITNQLNNAETEHSFYVITFKITIPLAIEVLSKTTQGMNFNASSLYCCHER